MTAPVLEDYAAVQSKFKIHVSILDYCEDADHEAYDELEF
jgi:hypothetical protein